MQVKLLTNIQKPLVIGLIHGPSLNNVFVVLKEEGGDKPNEYIRCVQHSPFVFVVIIVDNSSLFCL